MHAMMFEPKFYSPVEVAEILHVNPNTVRGWAETGHPTGHILPAMNTAKGVRRRLKIWGPDAEQFIRDCSTTEKVSRQHRAKFVRAPAKNYLDD